MKPIRLLSFLMLLSTLAISVMSFVDPTPNFVCFKYTGPRPAYLFFRAINPFNYTRLPINTLLDCPTPHQVWCGYCIKFNSRYYNSAAAVDGEPLWDDEDFQTLIENNVTSTSLHGTELTDGNGNTGVFPYFEKDDF